MCKAVFKTEQVVWRSGEHKKELSITQAVEGSSAMASPHSPLVKLLLLDPRGK